MRIVALTGSIASGKSFALTILTRLRVRVCSADTFVRDIFISDTKTKAALFKRFPNVRDDQGEISRQKLAAQVYRSSNDLQALEKIVHPRVVFYRQRVLQQYRRQGVRLLFCEIPLLFESPSREAFSAIVMTFAPPFLRKRRAFQRPAMNKQHWQSITRRQMPDVQKRTLADILVFSGLGKAVGGRSIVRALYRCRNKTKNKKRQRRAGSRFVKRQEKHESSFFVSPDPHVSFGQTCCGGFFRNELSCFHESPTSSFCSQKKSDT